MEESMKKKKKAPSWNENRWVRLAVYCVATIFTSCVYYGWQQYSLLMYEAGAYKWLCDPGENRCDAQVTRVQNFYSIASGTEYIFSVVAGILLDNAGPRLCGIVGEVCWGLGALMQILSKESFQAYYGAAFLLGASVNLIAFPTMILEELFPAHKNVMISLMLATQTFATAIAPTIYAVVKATGISPKTIMSGYLIVVWIPVASLLVITLPWRRPSQEAQATQDLHQENGEPLESQSEHSINDEESTPQLKFEEELSEGDYTLEEISPPFTCKGFTRELKTTEWILFCIYYQLAMMMYTYYSTTLQERWGDDFSIFIGWMMLSQAPVGMLWGLMSESTGTMIVALYLQLMLVITYAFAFVPYMGIQYVTGTIFVFSQSWIWTTKYCFVADLFPRTNFGKLAGLIGFIAGLCTYANVAVKMWGSEDLWFGIFLGVGIFLTMLLMYLIYRFHAHKVTYKQYRKVPIPPSSSKRSFVAESVESSASSVGESVASSTSLSGDED